ncbi:MAG: rhomboid family intramembrane serine protease [Gammaproteobacteria bacterium]
MNLNVNIAAIAIFVVTIAASLLALYARPTLIQAGVFRPHQFARGNDRDTILTSGFLHADMGHLIFNMVTYFFFAFPMAEFYGSAKFLGLYFAGLLLSNLCTLRKHRNNPHYASLGASGAISAVLFAYVLYFPSSSLYIFPIPFPVPAPLFAIGYVAYSYYAATQNQGRINHDAHLCGALSGIAFVLVTDPGLIGRYLGST